MLAPQHVATKRKIACLTQQELAREANVSQSLIAKIERGLVKPTYDVMSRIDEALDQKDSGLIARDFAQHRPVFCKPKDTLTTIITLMSRHQFSQLPVRDGEVVGLLTEQEIFKGIAAGKQLVEEVMLPPPPIVHTSTAAEVVYSLLDHIPLLIVQEGRSLSVITKADVFRLYRKKGL